MNQLLRGLFSLSLLLLGAAPSGVAQRVDPAFEPTRLTQPIYTDNAAQDAQGRLIVSTAYGPFDKDQQVFGLLRINRDGSRDATFGNHWLAASGTARTIRVLPNGKILVVGVSIVESLTGNDLSRRNGLVVLNPDGTLDLNYKFSEGTGAMAGAVQSDGRILVGGDLTSFNGASVQGLVRLLPNGQLDPDFVAGAAQAGFNGTVTGIQVLPDGKIMVGGKFTQCAGKPVPHLVRLLPNGTLDPSFNAYLGTNDFFQAFKVQPDNKVLIANIEGGASSTGHVRRLLSDGSVDNSFSASVLTYLSLDGTGDNLLTVQPDGGILVSGSFTQFNGVASAGLVRLLPSGVIDPAVMFGTNANGRPSAICSLQDGSALICGTFTNFDNIPSGMLKVSSTGKLDPSFRLPVGKPGEILASLRLADGRILVGGSFTTINGVPATNLALLDANGAVDATYTRNLPALNNVVRALAAGPQGRVYVGGHFVQTANPARSWLLRLNPDGSQDNTLRPHGLNSAVYALATYSDGRLLAGGFFRTPTPSLIRFTADGAVDNTFKPANSVAPAGVSAFVLQRNERIALLDMSRAWFLGAQGDNEVQTSAVPHYLHAIAVQPDGKILVGGEFSSFGGAARQNMVRLLPSGQLDDSFNAGSFLMQNGIADVRALAVQADGRILCAGYFTSINNSPHRTIARLQADGKLDESFTDQVALSPDVKFLGIHPEGRLLVGSSNVVPITYQGEPQKILSQGLTRLLVPGLTGEGPAGLEGSGGGSGTGSGGTGSGTGTGTGVVKNVETNIYPVPTHDLLNVQAPDSTVWLTITVFDVLGRQVLTAHAEASRLQLSVAILPAATYVVRISTNNETLHKRLLVQH